MCNSIGEIHKKEQEKEVFEAAIKEGFGFTDFVRAFGYPFKFRSSLILGSIFFTFAYIGQNAYLIGGMWLIVGSLFCWMLANTITFGILANIVENMLQGKINLDFMPKFDEFSVWDDVLHPLLLVVSAHLVSFAALLAVIILTFMLIGNTVRSMQNDPQILQQQIEAIKIQAQARQDRIKQQTETAAKQAAGQPVENFNGNVFSPKAEEEDFEKMVGNIRNDRSAQNEKSNFNNFSAFFSMLTGSWGVPIIILAGLAFLWGIFYYPMALIVASYTRRISSTLNPLVGIDTIKRLGFDYLKILFFSFLLSLIGGAVSFIVAVILSPFNLSGYFNPPGLVISGILGFYFSVVFSTMIGFALFKNSNSLNLYRAEPHY